MKFIVGLTLAGLSLVGMVLMSLGSYLIYLERNQPGANSIMGGLLVASLACLGGVFARHAFKRQDE